MALEKKGDSGSKKGLILTLFLVIVLIAFGAYFFFFHTQPNDQEAIEMPQTDDTIQVEELGKSMAVTMSVKDVIGTKETKKRPKTRYYKKAKKGFHVRVASCQYSSCIRRYKALLKKRKLPVRSYKKTGTTRYSNLVSTMAFKKEVALRKAILLAELNKMPGKPTVIKHKELYRISMGYYPQRDKGLFMQSYLDQFQGHTKTYFSLEPIVERFKYTNIYTGPFSSKVRAEKILEMLQNSREFFNLEVIRNPKRDHRGMKFE